MKWKRAIGMGLLAYIVTFIAGILIATFTGVDTTTAADVPATVWYMGIILMIIITALFSMWYFRNAPGGTQQGLHLGFVFIGVGFVLDSLLLIPYVFMTGSFAEVSSYYTTPYFWASLALILGTTALIGWMKGDDIRPNTRFEPKRTGRKRNRRSN